MTNIWLRSKILSIELGGVFEREIQDEFLSFESIARFGFKSQSSDQGFQNLSNTEHIES